MHCCSQAILNGLLLATLILSGCATPVFVDYDDQAVLKFDRYKCFAIDIPEAQGNVENAVFSPIVKRRFARELEVSLKARGYTDDCSTPDFRVWFYAYQKTVTDADFHIGRNITFFRYDCFAPEVGYFPQPYFDQYEEGTFLIDIIDTQSNELVWRGTYLKRLQRRAPNEAEIRTIIDNILDRFPPKSK